MEIKSKIKNTSRFQIDVGVILFVSLLLTLPFYFWGIPGGADMPQHYQFAQTFYDSISNGVLYPSWSPDVNFGYGDVGIRFYPPLTYYVLSFFRFLAGNWYEGSCLTITFFFFISGLGVYKWSNEFFDETSSLVGGLIYLIIPYHLFQIYQASLFAEFAAASILPFCFLYSVKICRKGRFPDIFRLGVAFGLLILTHLPTTIMASLALSIYVVFSIRKSVVFQTIFKLGFAVLFSLMLSCFYWARMITELDWVKHNTAVYSSGNFSFRENFAFPFLGQIFGVELNSNKVFLTNMVLVMLGVLLPVVIVYFQKIKELKFPNLNNLLAMTTFSLFMVLPISLPVWNFFYPLQKIQFPWRWLIFVSLGIAIFAAFSFNKLVSYYKTSKRYLSILAIGLLSICLFYNAFWVINHLFYIPKDFFIGMTIRLKTAKSNDCWWTNWVPSTYSPETDKIVSKFERLPEKISVNERNVEIGSWNSTERVFSIVAGEEGQVLVATMYYPYWRATINGKSVEINPNESGLISFPISKDESLVRLYFEEPKYVIFAFYISGLAWIIFFVFCANSFRKLTQLQLEN